MLGIICAAVALSSGGVSLSRRSTTTIYNPTGTNTIHAIQIVGDSIASGLILTSWSPPGDWGTYTNANCYLYRGGDDIATTNAIDSVYAHARWGAELSLADLMVAQWGASNCVVIVTGYPGATLNTTWTVGSAAWNKAITDRINVQNLLNNPVQLEGLIFITGANDASSSGAANAWQTNAETWVPAFRTAAGVTNLPVSVVLLSPDNVRTYASTVRTKQNIYTASASLVGTNDVDSFGLQGDGVHPVPAAYLQIGSNAWDYIVNNLP